MIIQAVLELLKLLAIKIISFLPTMQALPSWASSAIGLVRTALWFFPPDVWRAIVVNITVIVTGLIVWSIVEWVYKKLPGIS